MCDALLLQDTRLTRNMLAAVRAELNQPPRSGSGSNSGSGSVSGSVSGSDSGQIGSGSGAPLGSGDLLDREKALYSAAEVRAAIGQLRRQWQRRVETSSDGIGQCATLLQRVIMADTAGQWHALIDCSDHHRRPVARSN